MNKQKAAKETSPCPRCGRTVTHRTARQLAVCLDTMFKRMDRESFGVQGREGFTIDGPQDRLAVSFAPAF